MNRFHHLALTALAVVSLAIGCRAKPSMASRSATAYREAVAKGIPVGSEGHGGEHAKEMTGMPPKDMEKNMPRMQLGSMANMPGMEHGSMKNMSGMQHGSMANMPGMEHGAMKNMPGMEHGAMEKMPGMHGMAGMQHGSPASVIIAAPSTSSGIAQLSPTSTLQQDSLDKPSPTAVEEAKRATGQPPEEKQ